MYVLSRVGIDSPGFLKLSACGGEGTCPSVQDSLSSKGEFYSAYRCLCGLGEHFHSPHRVFYEKTLFPSKKSLTLLGGVND